MNLVVEMVVLVAAMEVSIGAEVLFTALPQVIMVLERPQLLELR